MINIFQDKPLDLLQTKKTVDWLVNNTSVSVFDPVNFTGYQRQIDNRHCMRIVEFLKKDFFMPTAIICATDDTFQDNSILRIVDGQHRVNAFRIMKTDCPERYDQIKDYELPVIVMAKVDENTEIDTFITINKTSKKVDTSLALVLKNKMNKYNTSDDLSMPKAEYIAVELAQLLNYNDDPGNIWFDKILFEGNPKNTTQLISLNAFVKSTRFLLRNMEKVDLISLNWNSQGEIDACLEICYKLISSIWSVLRNKWPDLFNSDLNNRRIIQGAIGYTAFNKVIVEFLNNTSYSDSAAFISNFEATIREMQIDSDKWVPGNIYSKYSSESGYNIVAREILFAMGK